ncbi:aspartate--tRNA ligase [Candidatus Saccharibacteria bacterium]|nr:aspartate--tRNA ligase [Candidatus Saccharibacteria bacterium]
MNRTLSRDTPTLVNESVTLKGWVHNRRDHGGLIFIDLRDHTGLVQLVFNPATTQDFALAGELRDEFVIEVNGKVVARDETLKNDKLPTGTIEVVVQSLRILNRSEALPIQPFSDEQQANEELRLRYRYLDLRREKMQTMLKKRAAYYKTIRDYMEEREFTEITTPILANSSPEGARDFLVPSRVHEGKYYALPQAPQQFKQLLMVGGVSRYYQIATCFRDEDPRADRLYGDFYQLDLEMAFVEDGETVRQIMEPLITGLVTDFAGKRLSQPSVPRITYREAIEQYGSDKPDLRYDMKLVDMSDIYVNSEFGVFKNAITGGGLVKAIRVQNGVSLSRSQIDAFTDIAKREGAGGLAYLMIEDGEVKSPIAKFMSADELTAVRERLQANEGDAIFFAADTYETVHRVLGKLRSEFAAHFNLANPDEVALVWVIDFPFYEWNETEKRVDFGHNPFSMPRGGVEAIRLAEDKLSIVADQYDMVMNGYEICSGAVRNHNPEIMYESFAALGYDSTYVEEKFGAMLNAFKFGAPPHAGCAYGLDRIFMVLTDEDNIREVVAFPKNGSGVDVMMNSPSHVDPAQLSELGGK